MDVSAAIEGRRSIRKFKPDEVPKEMISEILEKARWTPSWANIQPWELYVITGNILEKFREANRHNRTMKEAFSSEIPMPTAFSEPFNERWKNTGKSILDSLSIPRGDTEARKRYFADVFSLFGAPCLILVCLDRGLLIEYAMLDVGLFMQSLCLLAYERGLGTSMLAASVCYPKILRNLLGIPDDKVIVMGAALGYPDWDSPVNHFERKRVGLNEFITWVS